MRDPNRKRVDTDLSSKAYRKLQGEAKALGRTFRKHCSIVLEQHSEGDNGIYRALHPVKKKNP